MVDPALAWSEKLLVEVGGAGTVVSSCQLENRDPGRLANNRNERMTTSGCH